MGENEDNHKVDHKISENEEKKEHHVQRQTNAAGSFFDSRILKVIFILILLIIPLGLSFHYRIQPKYLPKIDDIASDQVTSFYKTQIQNQVDEKFAYLSSEKKEEVVNDQLNNFMAENPERISEETNTMSETLKKSFQDEDNNTYLLAIDPYLQYQFTKNYVENGHVGDEIINGKSSFSLRRGRLPYFTGNRLHPWIMSKWYSIMKIFNPDVSIMYAVFLFPVFWVTLAIIPAFFLGRRISGGYMGGFVAAVIIAVHHAILSRTSAGFSDTDCHNVFFPLLIVWLIVEAWNSRKPAVKYICTALSGVAASLYYLAWSGWWFTFDFVLGALGAYLVYEIIVHIKANKMKNIIKEIVRDSRVKNSFYTVITFILSTTIVGVFLDVMFRKTPIGKSLMKFSTAIIEPLNFMRYQEVGITTIWPNVLTTVAELNQANIAKVISYVGGPLVVGFALLGIALSYTYVKKGPSNHKKIFMIFTLIWYIFVAANAENMSNIFVLIFMIWIPLIIAFIYLIANKEMEMNIFIPALLTIFISGTFYAATRGVRFTALSALFVALGVGVFGHKIYQLTSDEVLKYINNRIWHAVAKVLLIAAVLWLLIFVPNTLARGWTQAKAEIPSVNDAWVDVLHEIRDNSDDAIITSWWDFGHWFYSLSERRVTFDGGDQGKRIHWVGKTLLTNNEEEAVNILRMLNCGENEAYSTLENYTGDQYQSIGMVYDILSMTKSEAEQYLKDNNVPEDVRKKVMGYTFCEDLLDQYFIASEDMIGKSGVWGHFGIWDFDRAYMFNQVRKKSQSEAVKFLEEEYNFTEKDAVETYKEIKDADGDQWISSWPAYMSEVSGCSQAQEDIMTCTNGIIINTTSMDAFAYTEKGLRMPYYFSYINNESRQIVKQYSENRLDQPLSVIYFNKNGKYYSVLANVNLAASMFTRMFFFEGQDLKYFDLVKRTVGPDGLEIYLYKLDWNKTKEFWDK